MRAAVVEQIGQAPRCIDVEEPIPATGMVVADVRAAAIKNIERALVAGTHYASTRMQLPAQVGLDAVVTLPDGRRAYSGATPPAGAMAERMAVDPGKVVAVPDGIDDATAAAVPNAAVSAWFALEYAGRIRPGQCVLVLGGTGVAGSLTAQLAKHRFGAERVVVAGRNTERLRRLRQLGADETLRIGDPGAGSEALADAITRMHAENPFDLVVDYLWGMPAQQTLHALGGDDLAADVHHTRFVQVGETAGPTVELPAAVLRSAGIELVGQGGGSVPHEAFARIGTEILPALFSMLAEGVISVETSTRTLDEVADAWTETTPSGVRMVLTP